MINVQQYFDNIQTKYNVNKYASFGITSLFRRIGVKKINTFKDKKVLDLMSGQGENLKYIKKINQKTEIVTLDFSFQMNKKLYENFKNKLNINQLQIDFFDNNIPNNSFDIILCSYGVKTIDSNKMTIFVKELDRILNKNGDIVLVEFVKPKTKWKFICVKIYIENIITMVFGKDFKILFHYINEIESLDNLKENLIERDFNIISHKRFIDLIEILHVKKH